VGKGRLRRLRSLTRHFCTLVLVCLWAASPVRAEPPKRVLVLYENSRLLPANIEGDRGLNEVIASSGLPVDVRAEFLDYPDFGGDAHVQIETTYLHEKYRESEPDIVVAGGAGALEFILNNRQKLFPRAPVVHMGVPKSVLDGWTLPPDVFGIPVEYDAIGTIDQALRWHPRVTRLVVVSGDSPEEQHMLAELRRDLPRFGTRLAKIDYLTRLATEDMRKRVAALGPDTIIFTPGYYQDATGRSFTPRQAAAEIAAAASVPVYGPYNTFIGTGVVGVHAATFLAMGQAAGGIVDSLLERKPVSGLPASMPTRLSVDWRQIERWGIDQKAVPADALVQFRAPGFWDQYRTPALITLCIVLLQSVLLTWLLVERRRRRTAEAAVSMHRFELAHASRLAVAGELTAAIAHEINQPLGAIQNNVAAAMLLLEHDIRPEEIRPILDDIGRDNVRASDVIKQLRNLLKKHEVERQVIDLNNSLAEMEILLRAEAQRRRLKLTTHPSGGPVLVMGDRVQILQILINLVLNAMDAVANQSEELRVVTASAAGDGNATMVEVSDTGHGIDPAHETKLFDSFFSTKTSGIGLGLAIVRTLVEAHGGNIRAENRPSGGAAFRVSFPLAPVSSGMKVAG
jgi:signal transduction histidine kinase